MVVVVVVEKSEMAVAKEEEEEEEKKGEKEEKENLKALFSLQPKVLFSKERKKLLKIKQEIRESTLGMIDSDCEVWDDRFGL